MLEPINPAPPVIKNFVTVRVYEISFLIKNKRFAMSKADENSVLYQKQSSFFVQKPKKYNPNSNKIS